VHAGLARDAAGAVTGPIVVNSSRAILYAGAGEDYAQDARRVAMATRDVLAAAAVGGAG
jgi:orotidine-5'-phosphate decarboxylase